MHARGPCQGIYLATYKEVITVSLSDGKVFVTIVSKLDTAHRLTIHDAQMNYYGTRLATCSSDNLIKIFEVHCIFFFGLNLCLRYEKCK
ncbi:unnamed protein product [Brugia timori]|uniref:WD_REPEATS_REGION domain-containing protein n=1 Tax=Brugia timori TaxID=42155 RepID=A0A0R3RB54_9BILA|nr:unnamed protein product [Brugia timori]